MSPRHHAMALLLGTAVLWSTGGVLIKWMTLSPMAIAGFRSAIAAVFLLLVLRHPHYTWSWTQVSGALALAASMLGFVAATKWTTAANAIVLVYTAPVYVALLSAWLLKEPIRARDWYTILCVLIGMACFVFERLSSTGWWGNLCAVGSGLATAWLVLCLRKQRAASPLETMLLGNAIAACAGLPWMFEVMPDALSWGALAFAGVVQIGISSVLYCRAVKHVQAIEAALIPVIEPLLNPLWVLLAVGEMPSAWALLGGGIVLGAITVRGLSMGRASGVAVASAPVTGAEGG